VISDNDTAGAVAGRTSVYTTCPGGVASGVASALVGLDRWRISRPGAKKRHESPVFDAVSVFHPDATSQPGNDVAQAEGKRMVELERLN
jgi:hypothetical protein